MRPFRSVSCAISGPDGTGPKTWASLRDNKGLGTAGFLGKGREIHKLPTLFLKQTLSIAGIIYK